MLTAAALLLFCIGLAHSILGERFILVRLFRRPDLPPLFGGAWFTVRTLRFAWHLTSIAWFGLAALLVQLASGASAAAMAAAIGIALLLSGLVALVFTKGRHLVWPVFLAAGALCIGWVGR